MQIAICDDDALVIEQLQKYIEQYFRKQHLSCPKMQCFTTGDALLADETEKDLIFLDVEMPGVDGIHTGNILRNRYPNVIIFIISSYMEYLDDAMKEYHTTSSKIAIETKENVQTLALPSIITIEASKKKSIVHTADLDYNTIHPIQYWTEHLPAGLFFQTHRSFIVNMEHVSDFDHSLVHMDVPGLNAYLTQRRYRAFKEAYLLFLESMR